MTVDKSEDRIRSMFAAIAGRYDFLNHLLSLNVDRYWRRQTVRMVAPNGNDPVLDVCTGTGDLALAYYNAGGRKVQIVGADFCHEMLVLGRKKCRAVGGGRPVVLVEADTQQLPFPDDYFQIVSVGFGLRNVTDTRRGLQEMVRVCRPGGKVAVLEFSIPQRQPFRALYRWYFRNILPSIGRVLARKGPKAYNYLPQSVDEFPSGEALAQRMRTAGLHDVCFHDLTFGIATLYVGNK